MQYSFFVFAFLFEVEPFISGLGSYWDFPSMMGAAAAWFVWQNFIVRFHTIFKNCFTLIKVLGCLLLKSLEDM